jgi:hypothetical protein
LASATKGNARARQPTRDLGMDAKVAGSYGSPSSPVRLGECQGDCGGDWAWCACSETPDRPSLRAAPARASTTAPISAPRRFRRDPPLPPRAASSPSSERATMEALPAPFHWEGARETVTTTASARATWCASRVGPTKPCRGAQAASATRRQRTIASRAPVLEQAEASRVPTSS